MRQFIRQIFRTFFFLALAAGLTHSPVFGQTSAAGQKRLEHRNETRAETGYVLGPGDQISVWALGAEDLSQKAIRVDASGYIDVPMAGRVKAAGLTADQLKQQITELLKTQLKNPQVTVNVTEFGSQPVSVIGAVNKPGVQQIEGRRTLIEALSMAGGLANDSGDVVRITRRMEEGALPLPGAKRDASGGFTTAEISLTELMRAQDPRFNIGVRANDVIAVPRSPIVYVMGEVKKPGGFAFGSHGKISVLQALALAEGLTHQSVPAKAKILRDDHDGPNRREIPIDVKKLLAGKSQDVSLQPDDILFIPDSQARNFAIRALETAVNIGSGITIWRVGLPSPTR